MVTKKKNRQRDTVSARYLPLLGPKYDLEGRLSKFAAKSSESKGRTKPISPDLTRTEYERDADRISFCLAFRRLKHKTQVFYIPHNDHICTRMDHALQVASISNTICKYLDLNVDLANAIALGHDLGHPPFGHAGEEALNEVCQQRGSGDFMHEAHSLRIVETMPELHGETLNLTYEVRDGIVCHCGERYDQILKPQKNKDVTLIDTSAAHVQRPYTLEGCVVRYADRVAYLAADLQDALELKIIGMDDIPLEVRSHLGIDSGEIIGKLTQDIIIKSKDNNYIATSDSIFKSMELLYKFSVEHIYNCKLITEQKPLVKKIILELFDKFATVFRDTHGGKDKESRRKYESEQYRVFFEFLDSLGNSNLSPDEILLSYIAGMTDKFAFETHRQIFYEPIGKF